MKLLIDPKEFVIVLQKSCYNNNIYKHKKHRYEITERCNEFTNDYSYYLEEGTESIYLGLSEKSMDDNEIIEIEFKDL